MKILVVCSGNICRSPVAAALLRARARGAGLEDIVVDSAGTLGIAGASAARETIDVAREIGIDLRSHRSKGVTREDVCGADLVVVMESAHLDELAERFPGPGRRWMLGAFEQGPEPRDDARDVDDPIGSPIDVHRVCLGAIEPLRRPSRDLPGTTRIAVTRDRSMTCARYAREVERRWCELHEGPVVLSPKDWEVLREWYELGVPLALVDEAIATLKEGRRRRPPTALSRLDASVRAGWSTVRGGRTESTPARPGNELAPALERWLRVRDAQAPGSPLRLLIDRLAESVARGGDPAAVDLELDRELEASCPPALLCEVGREIERELAPYRERIEGSALETSRRRAFTRRLRARLGLPRLRG